MFNMWLNKLFLVSVILTVVSAQQDSNKLISTFLRETTKIEQYQNDDLIVSPLSFIKSLVPLADLINHKYRSRDFLVNLAMDNTLKQYEIYNFLNVLNMMNWNIWFHDKKTLKVINEQLRRMRFPSDAIHKIPINQPASLSDSRGDLTPVKEVIKTVKAYARNSKLVVLSAIVFKASWKYPFDPKFTEKNYRYVTKDRRQNILMMSGTFNIFTGTLSKNEVTTQWIELPYEKKRNYDELSMYIFKQDAPFEKLESTLADMNFNNLVGEKKNIELIMPKFTIKKLINLQPILQKMGLGKVFKKNKTGFHIDKFLQTIEFSVSEFGTAFVDNQSYLPPEVDAGARPISFDPIKPSPSSSSAAADMFWVNSPFVYAVVHKQSGLPLLFGHYVDFKWMREFETPAGGIQAMANEIMQQA